MNLEDLLRDDGLQQDEWSLSAPVFGCQGQLKVLGYGGEVCRVKQYITKCDRCAQDPELYGEGYFKTSKQHLLKGSIPCGCGKRHEWDRRQYEVLCKRRSTEAGYDFVGFEGVWRYSSTKVKLNCKEHGTWVIWKINHLLTRTVVCPLCPGEDRGRKRLPNEVMVSSFFASGAFHPDTKFQRSGRKASSGGRVYWHMFCPICQEEGEAAAGDLKKGNRPCGCSSQRQQEGYINLILEGAEVVAIKFGIANNSKQRIKNQDRKSAYEIQQHSVYTFPDVASCKKAERECKNELETEIILKRDMQDGYTETTWTYNLDKIIEIYERNGGIRKINP